MSKSATVQIRWFSTTQWHALIWPGPDAIVNSAWFSFESDVCMWQLATPWLILAFEFGSIISIHRPEPLVLNDSDKVGTGTRFNDKRLFAWLCHRWFLWPFKIFSWSNHNVSAQGRDCEVNHVLSWAHRLVSPGLGALSHSFNDFTIIVSAVELSSTWNTFFNSETLDVENGNFDEIDREISSSTPRP